MRSAALDIKGVNHPALRHAPVASDDTQSHLPIDREFTLLLQIQKANLHLHRHFIFDDVYVYELSSYRL